MSPSPSCTTNSPPACTRSNSFACRSLCSHPRARRSDASPNYTSRAEIGESLVTLPPHETLNKLFQSELEKRGLRWQPKVEVNSLDLIQNYVAQGYGIGVAVDIPGRKLDPGLRRIPLSGFPPLRIALIHQGGLNLVAKRFAETVVEYAAAFVKKKKPRSQ